MTQQRPRLPQLLAGCCFGRGPYGDDEKKHSRGVLYSESISKLGASFDAKPDLSFGCRTQLANVCGGQGCEA